MNFKSEMNLITKKAGQVRKNQNKAASLFYSKMLIAIKTKKIIDSTPNADKTMLDETVKLKNTMASLKREYKENEAAITGYPNRVPKPSKFLLAGFVAGGITFIGGLVAAAVEYAASVPVLSPVLHKLNMDYGDLIVRFTVGLWAIGSLFAGALKVEKNDREKKLREAQQTLRVGPYDPNKL